MAANKLNRYWTLTAILLVAIILIGGVVVWSRYSPNQPLEISLPPQQEWQGMIYIGGAVTNPGYYPFTSGDNLEALVQAAGGTTASANSTELTLFVPAVGAEPEPQKVDINRAELWLLEALPGVGPTLAQRIVDYRQQNGPFLNTGEIVKVAGIGASTYDQIRDLITVAD